MRGVPTGRRAVGYQRSLTENRRRFIGLQEGVRKGGAHGHAQQLSPDHLVTYPDALKGATAEGGDHPEQIP